MLKDKYCCGLDIGARTIKAALITEQEPNKSTVQGVFEVKTCGFRSSSVSDLAELTECVHAAVAGLSEKCQVKIKGVFLGISGELIAQRPATAVIPLLDRGSKVIAARDVKKVQAQARLLGVNMEETVLHELPQYYRVDDVNVAVNPVGLSGRKLEIQSLMITIPATVLRNLVKAVNQAGYDVARVSYASLAAAGVALTPFHRRQGCLLMDVGSSLTNLLVFKEDQLRYVAVIPWGGGQVTQGIAARLNIPLELADDIKKSYATVVDADHGRDEELLIKKDGQYLPIKKRQILEAVDPEVGSFLDEVKTAVQGSGFFGQLNEGVVMAGGGALLPGLPERVEQQLNLPVKIGWLGLAARRMPNAAKYAAALGLAQDGMPFSCGGPDQPSGQGNRVMRIVNRVKELYQEYF